MKLEDFLKFSALQEIEVTSLYFKPEIPQDKLVNAIRAYAPNVGMSTVIGLVDETFWGNAKEGMIITNDEIILSKKLGGQVIPLTSVSQIAIKDKNLIVNDLPVAKFSNPELLPLSALGAKLNEFVSATIEAPEGARLPTALDDATTEKLSSFLARLTEPRYFESVPVERRKSQATTTGYALAADINEEQRQLLRFKGRFATNEEIICASWLDNHDNKDYFFCVTTCGIYSVIPSRSLVFISHDDLLNLSAVEEYKEGRYIGLRFSNGQGIIVSIQNAFVRPYAQELLTGLIDILNGREPAVRIDESNVSQPASTTASSAASPIRPENEEARSNTLNAVEQNAFEQQTNSCLPFRKNDNDQLFDTIIQVNSIENVGNFIGSVFSNSDNTNSKIRKKFQSYVARSITSFRNEVVENGHFSQFKNDIATMEICGTVMAFTFLQMQERGVNETLATKILFEGIRATLSLESSAQSDPKGTALIKIIESYVPDEGDNLNDLFLNAIFRLVGSNLSGRLYPNYSEVLREHAHVLEDFISTIAPVFNKFVKKMVKESDFLINGILDARW
ncbi:MAG: hypothetical protein JJU03_00235 [Idiomarina sp.]|nr:hypothetical protein [Idiomarina sp.]